MSSYINKTIDLTTSDVVILPVNGRWSDGDYSVVVTFAGTGTVTVEGTLSKVNRGESFVPFDITGLTAVTTDTSQSISSTPLEALRITGATMAGGGAQVQIMGAGSA
jgi:hypothetical protein